MADFRNLRVWRKAHALALNVHSAVAKMRGNGISTLRSQMLRAAMSVPTNIVEGSGKNSDKEFARFVKISIGSLCELEYHLIFASDTHAIAQSSFNTLLDQLIAVRKMLSGFLSRLERSKPKRSPVKNSDDQPRRDDRFAGSG